MCITTGMAGLETLSKESLLHYVGLHLDLQRTPTHLDILAELGIIQPAWAGHSLRQPCKQTDLSRKMPGDQDNMGLAEVKLSQWAVAIYFPSSVAMADCHILSLSLRTRLECLI